MITPSMKIRRHLRSARVSALTSAERLEALRAAERRIAQDGGREDAAVDVAHEPRPGAHADTP